MIEIRLTKGYFALVDDEDSAAAAFRWQAKVSPSGLVHAQRGRTKAERTARPGPRTVYLHRELLGEIPVGLEVDHVNGNGLDCRRGNLRLATSAENNCNVSRRRNNRSGYRGVSLIRRFKNGREVQLRRPWVAQIQGSGTARYLGLFATAEEAAAAWDAKAREAHGAFARLNFPEGAFA